MIMELYGNSEGDIRQRKSSPTKGRLAHLVGVADMTWLYHVLEHTADCVGRYTYRRHQHGVCTVRYFLNYLTGWV